MRRPAGPVPSQQNLIVGHQGGLPTFATGETNEAEGQRRFAGPGRPEDQDTPTVDGDKPRMPVVDAHTAGSEMMKRAPATPPGALSARMFSAVSVPACASTICRLMERPSPEFWPKASPAGLSV